jgi:hypothetical protein
VTGVPEKVIFRSVTVYNKHPKKIYLHLLIFSVMSTGSKLDLQLGSQSSTGNMRQGYQKKLHCIIRSVIAYNKKLSSQCNLPAQIEHVLFVCLVVFNAT